MAGERQNKPDDSQTNGWTDNEIIEAIAYLLAQRGYRLISDAELPRVQRALQPFLVAAEQ